MLCMRNLLFLSCLSFFLTTLQGQKLTLVKRQHSKCVIIIPDQPEVVEVQAAMVFQDYIQRISGCRIPIKSDETKPQENEIVIGRVNRSAMQDVPYKKLKKDGFIINSTGQSLIIAGGTEKGVLYGVYAFLEKYLGCRKYSSAVTIVPKKKTIVLPSIHDLQVPTFTYREDFYRDAVDPEYAAWHKLDSHGEHGYNTSEWGSWVHTFESLLSPKEYGESHPEYFSFYDGKRHAGMVPSWDGKSEQPEAQLCLTNPDVLEIVCQNLQAQIERNPEAIYWSVSQNDNVHHCQCTSCQELDEKYAAFTPGSKMYGTHANSLYSPIGMGSLLTFVNQVAARFPEKMISTLAYQYTRVPPKDIVPAKNVNIMLCNIESSRNTSIVQGDTSFVRDLVGWGKLTNNIIVWDYVIQFPHLFAPFPNLYTLQPNLQFFHKNWVSAMFEQGNREIGGEFAELRSYLIAKLLWNPDLNFSLVMDDFLTGYYGKASQEIKKYIELLHENNMSGSGIKLSIFGDPVQQKESFLSDSLIAIYTRLFDRAERKVARSPEYLQRVKLARLPIYYAMLEIAKFEKTGKRGAFIATDHGRLRPNPKIVKMLFDFTYQCIQTNVTRISEWHTPPKEYLAKYLKFLNDYGAE